MYTNVPPPPKKTTKNNNNNNKKKPFASCYSHSPAPLLSTPSTSPLLDLFHSSIPRLPSRFFLYLISWIPLPPPLPCLPPFLILSSFDFFPSLPSPLSYPPPSRLFLHLILSLSHPFLTLSSFNFFPSLPSPLSYPPPSRLFLHLILSLSHPFLTLSSFPLSLLLSPAPTPRLFLHFLSPFPSLLPSPRLFLHLISSPPPPVPCEGLSEEQVWSSVQSSG